MIRSRIQIRMDSNEQTVTIKFRADREARLWKQGWSVATNPAPPPGPPSNEDV